MKITDNQRNIKDNIRLDKFLHNKFPNYSRSFLKSQIQQGNVLVNNKITKPSYILKKDDKVETNIIAPVKSILQPNPDIKLKIIYEDDNIIAINKPAGISTHPARPNQNDTIANALLAHYPPIKNVGDPSTDSGQVNLRPGIVHRLDKDTSGVMVAAKNQKTFDWLKKQFSERKIIKKYTALVHGKIKEKQGIISKPIGKTKDFRKRTTIPLKEQKEAITHYKVIEKYVSYCHPERSEESHQQDSSVSAGWRIPQNDKFFYSLIEAELKTGRTHQIRVHLASIGHPAVGDKLYGFKRQTPLKGLQRQFLHASYLKFLLPDGSIIELKSELADDLKQCLQNLKSSTKNN